MTSAATGPRVWMIARSSLESDAFREALRERDIDVTDLRFPETSARGSSAGQGLSGIAASLGAALREVVDGVDISGLEAQMRQSLPAPDAVVFLEAEVAARVQDSLRALLGDVRQIAVEPHLGLNPRWAELAIEVVSQRHGGGVLSGLGEEQRQLDGAPEHIVIATDGLAVGAVDSLLLQLSIAELGSRPLLFLPSGETSVDDHLKARAVFYGLSGQRPSKGSDLDGWIRGARLMIGRPSERQMVAGLSAGTATIWVGDLARDSGPAWLVSRGVVTHARAPVEVSVMVEEGLERSAPGEFLLAGPLQAADALMELLQRLTGSGDEPPDEVTESSLEPIGLAAVEPTESPEHERLEIDDALAQLKRRMGFNDDEG